MRLEKAENRGRLGLCGAGKSTLERPFIELGREVTKLAGFSPGEIQALYGLSAYWPYERKALEETISTCGQCVIAMPGGIISDAGTFNMLLTNCFTV